MSKQSNDRCPSPEELQDFLRSQLVEEPASGVEDHLASCDLCAETLVRLTHSDETAMMGSTGSAAGQDPSEIEEGVLDEADQTPPPFADLSVPAPVADTLPLNFLHEPRRPGFIGVLGSHDIRGVLGIGGMGVVLDADDPVLSRRVAMKVIKPAFADHPEARERFLREARAVAALNHDNIISIHHVGEDGVPFLTMPLLEGETLSQRLQRLPRLPVEQVLAIARQVADGLAAAHRSGIIHRDIKPANIWLERKTDRVKLLDFGLARLDSDGSQLTGTNVVAGTPEYMAPEQADSLETDARCDLFSMGAVMYRMLTGSSPFAAATPLATLSALANRTPPAVSEQNPDVSPEVSALIMKLLEKDREQRPQSADEVAETIQQLQQTRHGRSTAAPAPRRTSPARLPSARRKVSTAAIWATLLTVAVAGLAVFALMMSDQQPAVAEITVGPPVTVPVRQITIDPDPLPFQQNAALVGHALVSQPTPVDGVISWTIHDLDQRQETLNSVVSPDGQHLATTGRDMAIRIRHVKSGRLVKLLLGHERPGAEATTQYIPFSVGWSPDGQYLASAGENGPLILWDFASGRLLRRLNCPVRFPNGIKWSPDGTRIVVTDSSSAEDGCVLDAESGRQHFMVHCISAAWSRDAKTLAAGRSDGRVHLIAAETGDVDRTIDAHDGPVRNVCFSPDNRVLGTGSYVEEFREGPHESALWDAVSGRCLRRQGGCCLVTFSADGTRFLTTDPEVTIRDTLTGEAVASIALGGRAPDAAWLPEGGRLMIRNRNQGGAPSIWDDTTGELMQVYSYRRIGKIRSCQISPDGRRLLHDYQVHTSLGTAVWDLPEARLASVRIPGHAAIWSPDGSRYVHGDTLTTLIRDAATGELDLQLSDSQGARAIQTQCGAFTLDGARFAKLNSGTDVAIVNVDSGKLMQTLNAPTHVKAAAWHPSGERIALIGVDGLVQVVAVDTKDVVQQQQMDPVSPVKLAWSSDGNWLAVAGHKKPVKLWNPVTGEQKTRQQNRFLTWMKTGSHCALQSGSTVQIVDIETNTIVRSIAGLPKVAGSADGRFLVSNLANTLTFFSGTDGRELGRIHCLTAEQDAARVISMQVSPDGHWFSETGRVDDMFVYVVQTPTGQETLTSAEFTDRYGWRNRPEKARFLTSLYHGAGTGVE